jgi:hypothetical protein
MRLAHDAHPSTEDHDDTLEAHYASLPARGAYSRKCAEQKFRELRHLGILRTPP